MTKNYLLIGAGMMGHEHLKNVALLDGAQVIGIYEPDDAMAGIALELAPEAMRVESLDQGLALQPDAVIIASPNHLHATQLSQLGELPVLVEKPICVNESEFADLAVQSVGKPWWVAMEYRYMPPIASLIQQVHGGAVGDVQMLSIREHRFPFLDKVNHWNRFNANSGGTLVEKCCHFFDLMRVILRSNPVRIYASGGQAFNHLDERYEEGVPDILDHAFAVVDFENGQKASLELSMFAEGSEYQEHVSVVGREAKIEAMVPGPTRFWKGVGPAPEPKVVLSPRAEQSPRVVATPVDPALLAAGDHNGSTFYQHERFLKSLQGGPIEVSAEDGLWAVRMGLAAQESIEQGRAIEF